LLQAYSVVPEVIVNASVDRSLIKNHSETYSEFAFRLGTQFTPCWLESEDAYSDEICCSMSNFRGTWSLDPELRVWLIEQKPKNVSDAARLADQYVAVRKAERPAFKGFDSAFKGQATRPKSFRESGRIATLVWASRKQPRLATMLSHTMSRSPQLLQPVANSTVLTTIWHLEYFFL